MKHCKKCLQPDTRPNILFDEHGVCPACTYASTLGDVDWKERRKKLDEIVEFGKRNNQSGYDCIIGVSGGKDSLRQAVYVKEELGLKPLLVSLTYPPEQQTHMGAYNISNMINRGFDCVMVGPSPKTWQRLMREAFLKYGNWGRSTELSLFSSVPRLAIAYQIPLILWGENPALTLGELGNKSSGWDGNNMKHGNTLGGGKYDWLLVDGIKPNNILQYRYPADHDMDAADLQIVYLGYFWDRWSKLENGIFGALHGLQVRDMHPNQIGDILGVDALDDDWVALNQMIKYLKFGFGKVTEIVCEEIRYGRMSREQAIDLVRRYDGKCSDQNIASFCEYIGITVNAFWELVDGFVNKDLFDKTGQGKYVPKFDII